MNFTELQFWPRLFLILAIILIGRAFVRSVHARSIYDRIALACLNLTLLCSVGMLTTCIFASVFLTAWLLLQIMMRLEESRRKWILAIGIPLLCAPLFYYKYSNFVANEILRLHQTGLRGIAIPAGISFYTFQKIAMLIDAYRMKTWRPKFLDYLNFASFFPQVVAGPIERKGALFPQMEAFSFSFSWERLNAGAPWLITGLFYKLGLADNLAGYIDRESMDSAWPVLITTFIFGLKIYFDFCGYSLIALGLAKCLGVELTLNFESPYWSSSVREFWRRWHISLSSWLRDYIYFPMGGNRTKRWWLNLLILFIVSGIWHGAGWGFLLWGTLHGLYCIVAHFCRNKFTLPNFIAWPLTMVCVFAAWLPFYENRLPYLIGKAKILIHPAAYSLGALKQYLGRYDPADTMTMGAAIALCLAVIGLEGLTRLRGKPDYSFARHPVAVALLTVLLIFLGATQSNEFIYFSF